MKKGIQAFGRVLIKTDRADSARDVTLLMFVLTVIWWARETNGNQPIGCLTFNSLCVCVQLSKFTSAISGTGRPRLQDGTARTAFNRVSFVVVTTSDRTTGKSDLILNLRAGDLLALAVYARRRIRRRCRARKSAKALVQTRSIAIAFIFRLIVSDSSERRASVRTTRQRYISARKINAKPAPIDVDRVVFSVDGKEEPVIPPDSTATRMEIRNENKKPYTVFCEILQRPILCSAAGLWSAVETLHKYNIGRVQTCFRRRQTRVSRIYRFVSK